MVKKTKLPCISSLDYLRIWLKSKGKNNLYDISEWNRNGTWKNWNLGEVPIFLLNESHQFLMILNGSSPIHLNLNDSREWGEA